MADFSGNIIYFARFKGRTGKTYRIDIAKAGYTGLATEIPELSKTPLTYKHIDVESSNIQGTEFVFQFMCAKADYDTYDLLTQGADFEYQFKVYDAYEIVSGTLTTPPMWTGFVLPAETTRSYFDNISVYTITATDYLSKLKDYAFSDLDGNIPVSRERAIDMIGMSLYKIAELSRAPRISVQAGIVEVNMDSDCGIYEAYIHPSNFSKKRNGFIVADNCFDLCNNILKVFNSRLCSPVVAGGISSYQRYYVLNTDETESDLYLLQDVSTADGRYLLIQTDTNDCAINIDDYDFLRDSELSRKMPLKSLELIQHNYDLGTIVDAVDFNDMDNAAIWTLDDLTVTQVGAMNNFTIQNATSGYVETTNGYTLLNENGNAYIRVNFIIKNNGPGTSYLLGRVKVIKTSGNQEIKTDILPTINFKQTYIYVSPASKIFRIEHGQTYKIRVEFINTSLLQDIDFSISNMIVSKYYAVDGEIVESVLFDYLFEAWSVDGAIAETTIETKIGDSDIVSNDSSITYSSDSADLTSDWHRYGVSENKSIQELIMQSYFNRFGGNSRILKIKVVDPEDTISLKNKITFDSNTYNILDIEKDFITSVVSLRLQQVSVDDIPITFIRKEIPNTNNTGTSSSAVSGGITSQISLKRADLSGDDNYNEVTVQNAGLLRKYYFNGNARNGTDGGYDGTVSGATLTTNRKSDADSAYVFDGGDYISVPITGINGLYEVSVSVWFYATTLGNSDAIMFSRGSTNYILGVILSGDSNDIVFYVGNGTTTINATSIGNIISANTWYHIVGTWKSGDYARIYVDNVLQGTSASTMDGALALDDVLKIGWDDFAGDRYFIGKIDDIRIYNRVLSLAEIGTLYYE